VLEGAGRCPRLTRRTLRAAIADQLANGMSVRDGRFLVSEELVRRAERRTASRSNCEPGKCDKLVP